MIVFYIKSNIVNTVPRHLRSHREIAFLYNPTTRLYTLSAGQFKFLMPYVVTLRLRRYFKENLNPGIKDLHQWYERLPAGEKLLVQVQFTPTA